MGRGINDCQSERMNLPNKRIWLKFEVSEQVIIFSILLIICCSNPSLRETDKERSGTYVCTYKPKYWQIQSKDSDRKRVPVRVHRNCTLEKGKTLYVNRERKWARLLRDADIERVRERERERECVVPQAVKDNACVY